MENVHKNYRFQLKDKTRIKLKKQIDLGNFEIKQNKGKCANNKLFIYINKSYIYLYNGDFYNYYRTYIKFKKYCMKSIEEYENDLENKSVFCVDFKNGDMYSKENGYIKYCDLLKENLDLYEKGLQGLYNKYKKNRNFII